MLRIIQQRKYAYLFSLVLTVGSVVIISIYGLRLGLDFKGGTMMEVRFASELAPTTGLLEERLATLSLQSLMIQPTEGNGMLIRYHASDATTNDQVLTLLQEFDPNVTLLRTDFIGSSVSSQMKKSAFSGTLLSLIGIALYIAWAFRKVSYPINSWEYGLGAIIALAHDIVITIGVFSLLGYYFGVEVGVPFIAALLTILGYSVNDTIVVYDRVRENLIRARDKSDFEGLVNRSLNETLGRSINTSMTVLIVLFAIAVFGGESVRWFAVALLVGVGFGTYSSIYIASALLVTRYRMKALSR